MDVSEAYTRYGPMVIRRARQILGDETEAQDVLQEVFHALLRKPSAFKGRSRLSTFLYGMTTHRALNRIRNSKTRQRLLEGRAAPVTPAASASGETHALLRQAFSVLTDKEAQAMIYTHLDHMSQREVGRMMGCSHTQVRQLLKSAEARVNHQAEVG